MEFVLANQNNLKQFADRSFNAIVSFNNLHLLKNQQIILNEVTRILTENGKYAISDNRSDLKILAKAAIWFTARTMPENFRSFWNNTIRSSYSLKALVELLLKTKLKDWKIRSSLIDFLLYKL